jgi:hypothetical protein
VSRSSPSRKMDQEIAKSLMLRDRNHALEDAAALTILRDRRERGLGTRCVEMSPRFYAHCCVDGVTNANDWTEYDSDTRLRLALRRLEKRKLVVEVCHAASRSGGVLAMAWSEWVPAPWEQKK